GGGLLTGKYTMKDIPSDSRFGKAEGGDIWAMLRYAFFTEKNFQIVDKVGEVARSAGTSHTTVAIAWTIAQRGVTSAIIGPRSVEQLEDNLAAGSLELGADALRDLDGASRGPI